MCDHARVPEVQRAYAECAKAYDFLIDACPPRDPKKKCLYSVPFRLVRQKLWLKATETTTQIFRDHDLVAVHPRRCRPGSRHTARCTCRRRALTYVMQDPQSCLKQSTQSGTSCRAFATSLAVDEDTRATVQCRPRAP